MSKANIVIFAGTAEARLLADALAEKGISVVSSFAGTTADPRLPRGEVRVGGFGGPEGIATYVKQKQITRLIDATHPYAAQISRNVHAAAQATGVPLLRLERPAWVAGAHDQWLDVPDIHAAVRILPQNSRTFLTIGHKGLEAFFARDDLGGLVRTIEPPRIDLPGNWVLVQQRPPYALADEMTLLERHSISHLVSKNSGGDSTEAKLLAARQLRLPVVMLARPHKPKTAVVHHVADALAWVTR